VLTNTLLDNVGDVLQGWGELLHFVEAKGDVVSNVTLVARDLKSLAELVLGTLVLLLFVEDAALGDDGLSTLVGQLANEGLGVGHLFEFVLDVHLNLDDFVRVLGVLDLGGDLASFDVHACLEEGLRMVELVLSDVGVELGQLIVVFSRLRVVLHVEVAVSQ